MADEWFAEDKWNHLTGSFFATYVFYCTMVGVLVIGPLIGIIFAPVLAFLCGLAVEFYQMDMHIDKFSWRDVVANTAGCLLAVATIFYL